MKFKANWPYLIFCVVIWTALVGFMGVVFMAIALGGNAGSRPDSGGYSWPAALASALVCFTTILFMPWKIYVDVNTIITEEYIEQPKVRGATLIAWSDVRKITTEAQGIQIYGPQGKIILSPYAYAHPDESISAVKKMAEKYSIPVN